MTVVETSDQNDIHCVISLAFLYFFDTSLWSLTSFSASFKFVGNLDETKVFEILCNCFQWWMELRCGCGHCVLQQRDFQNLLFCSWNEAVAFERHFWPDCVFKDCYGEHKKCK